MADQEPVEGEESLTPLPAPTPIPATEEDPWHPDVNALLAEQGSFEE